MSISLSRYVDITSNLAGAGQAVTRQLIARIFTNPGNGKLAPHQTLEFSNAQDVGRFFGFSTEEYYRASFYFSWISKEATYPQAIQYSRFLNNNSLPFIFSIPSNTFTLANWTAITSGGFILTMGAFTYEITGLNFSGATNSADVATIITNAIQAETGGGALWTSATVNAGNFNLTGGATGNAVISVASPSSGSDITGLNYLGWLPALSQTEIFNYAQFLINAIWVPGGNLESITTCLTNSAEQSDDFGSFNFLNLFGFTTSQILEAATWNNAQNVKYLYSVPVTSSNYAAVSSAVNSLQGTALTLVQSPIVINGTVTVSSNVITHLTSVLENLYVGMPVTGTNISALTVITTIVNDNSVQINTLATGTATEAITFGNGQYPEMFPMMIEASTNYGGINTVQNYMFQQVAGLTSQVTSDSSANTYDSSAINYYGQTQTSGNQISFYQRGLLQGSGVSSNITDMTAYVNEIWMKDALSVAIMNLLLSLTQIPANNQGRVQILAILQEVINRALANGTISVGKQLTANQIAFITNTTNDPKSWYQVQNSGYWVDVVIAPIPNVLPVQYQATYTLIYSKDDVIRKVVGQDFLI